MPKLFAINAERRPDGALVVVVTLDPTVADLSRVEQDRVAEAAMCVALEAAKTANDPLVQRELGALKTALDERRAHNQLGAVAA